MEEDGRCSSIQMFDLGSYAIVVTAEGERVDWEWIISHGLRVLRRRREAATAERQEEDTVLAEARSTNGT